MFILCKVIVKVAPGPPTGQQDDHQQHRSSDVLFYYLFCRNVGSRWALEQAKYNLVNEYLLVGVTEELEDFIMILEAALPRFFKGATELYRTGTNTSHIASQPSVCYSQMFVEYFISNCGFLYYSSTSQ